MSSGIALAPYFSVSALRMRKSVGRKRQCSAPQWMPVPPTPSPGRNAPNRRIGSPVSAGSLRNVMVSIELSCINSSRCTKRSSSRSVVSVNSSFGLRSAPRSSPTTVSPALVSSRAMMAPVHPMPTMTASTSLSLVAIVASLREIRQRARRRDVALVEILFDHVLVGGRQAREAEHLPSRLVAVAAIHRVGEEAFHHHAVQAIEEGGRGEVLELRLA